MLHESNSECPECERPESNIYTIFTHSYVCIVYTHLLYRILRNIGSNIAVPTFRIVLYCTLKSARAEMLSKFNQHTGPAWPGLKLFAATEWHCCSGPRYAAHSRWCLTNISVDGEFEGCGVGLKGFRQKRQTLNQFNITYITFASLSPPPPPSSSSSSWSILFSSTISQPQLVKLADNSDQHRVQPLASK